VQKRKLGETGMEIAPLVFGGNVLGWTTDQAQGFAVLDAFVAHGFDAIDTADVYSSWAPGHTGGESEAMIGDWLRARPGMKDRVKIFTKVGSDMERPGEKGLSERWIMQAVDNSLERLGVEVIDLYFSHWPDPETPQEETLGAFAKLMAAGKVRAIGASNVDAAQLTQALDLAGKGLPPYQVLQPEYNLYDRDGFEGDLRDLCVKRNLGVVTYFSLASGFLSGKYRSDADLSKSVRGEDTAKYLNPRGMALLSALDEVAERHSAKQAEVALAWVMAQPGVTAPIASATKVSHVDSFARAAELVLTKQDLAQLAV
jgi:aryl-alcohol dehydrogenase-like predicted oxidoreductase